MYKMHSDYISLFILPFISHQSFCYERHPFSVELDKAVKDTEENYLYMYFTKCFPDHECSHNFIHPLY